MNWVETRCHTKYIIYMAVNVHYTVNVAKYQKGVYYIGVKIFNALPSDIKTEFNNPKKFKMVLQKFLCEKSFYTLDEYFDVQKR